jgi:hypothetical protein
MESNVRSARRFFKRDAPAEALLIRTTRSGQRVCQMSRRVSRWVMVGVGVRAGSNSNARAGVRLWRGALRLICRPGLLAYPTPAGRAE